MARHIFLAVVVVMTAAGAQLAAQTTPAAQPAAAEAAKPNDYGDEKNWLCRPGRKGDACDIDLTTTVVAADGTLTREPFAANPKAAIDCFYVYPTISTDPADNSDMTADPAELNVIAQQFARFASVCRPYAPLYRQMTLVGLRKRLGAGAASVPFERGVQYDDVRDAWRQYLKADNQGRGVVIIGHSQGSYILMELIRQEVEGKPVQKQLVSAMILGATLETPKGKDVGGAFKSVPLCRKPGQIGCVVNFSAFRSTVTPPPNTLFGKAQDPAANSGSCTNPVTLGEGSAPLRAYLSNSGRTIVGTVTLQPWATGKTVETPYVSVPGLLAAKCTTNENATYLEVTVNGNPADPRVDDITGDLGAVGKPIANWGLHLIDVNLAIGNLIDLVAQQSKAYAARR